MKRIRAVLIFAAFATLSACASGTDVFVTRNLPADTPIFATSDGPIRVPMAPSYHVVDVNVTVPETLTISEANGFKPVADILWQEDPAGNRYQQVKDIMTAALEQGVSDLDGVRDVVVDVTMTRFHALTKRTRYSIGGEHEVWMELAIRDAETGDLVEPVRKVGFDTYISANQAVENEANGIDQRVEITQLVEQMIHDEMTRPRDFL